ncbi:Hypp1381 [Branchiostoma lanceolatum]|uniref:Hypp1381 protein n=1 Tax=Branchiostoma lanceolatum TaxID=7740 RepID=A0A8J9ZJ82_BRALA|nr:Hypp1381 [Branchiostoma lanceolatum]
MWSKILCSTPRWLGHVLRMEGNRTAKKILDWKPPGGRRSRGRPRLTWKANVEKDLEAVGSSWYRAVREAQQRDRWRRTARCASKAREELR